MSEAEDVIRAWELDSANRKAGPTSPQASLTLNEREELYSLRKQVDALRRRLERTEGRKRPRKRKQQ